ncbi:Jag N-terminal domain-containing protein [Xylocopilactobacillus apis]|uniref:RNA-binding protein KhpB n=1 Tax=Xylocopilactobacillus apis TaxID=2932183 RepID=A0AAU9CU71_9LACO|nr:Jag N-terminal domain-containing protein [Xylocopilactobacillus apis]BDR57554.1 RNA-binding protein [Xylocopilactobacillus apis]
MENNIYHGKDIEDAISAACSKLGVDRTEIHVEVVDPGKRGFLGFGRKEATIKVSFLKDLVASIEDPDQIDDELTKRPFTEQDEKSVQVIKKMLEDLFEEAGIIASVSFRVEDDQIVFKIDSEDYKGLIIGKKGKTINSLQSIAQTIYFHNAENRYYIVLDIDDYRSVRDAQIMTWLDQAINSVRTSGKSYRFSPMIAVERKVIIKRLSHLDDISFRVRGTFPRKYIEISKRAA